MRRREFVTLLSGAAAAAAMVRPLAARAQQPRLPVVGYLGGGSRWSADVMNAFRQGLAQAGYGSDQNVAIEYQWANAASARKTILAALVERQVAVIVTAVNSAAHMAKAATSTIPVVV